MKKALCMLLTLCLLCSLAMLALGEGHLEGKPWINPEWPENLPDERPALEDDFYLYINYDLHKRFAADPDAAKASKADATAQELKANIWRMVEAGETTEAKALVIWNHKRRSRRAIKKDEKNSGSMDGPEIFLRGRGSTPSTVLYKEAVLNKDYLQLFG